MSNWTETCRGSVPPWECDVTEHFTIGYYAERLDQAERGLADVLGIGKLLRGGGFTRHFYIRFVRELRAGSSFHIDSAVIGGDGGLRFGHRFIDSANGEVVTWVEARWDLAALALSPERQAAIAGRLAPWDGPAVEDRPEPATSAGFFPTSRGRIKPGDLDADSRMSLGTMVHRFTDGSMQSGAAIGMDAGVLERDRRGFSTFELAMRVSGALGLDDPYLVESGIVHLGNSSMRLIHRLSDPRSGAPIAQMSQYGVNLDLDARRAARWPEAVRNRTETLVIPMR